MVTYAGLILLLLLYFTYIKFSLLRTDPILTHETSVIDINIAGIVVGVWVSCAEIYNEQIYDLLSEDPSLSQKTKKKKPPRQVLRCAEDSNSNVFIKGTYVYTYKYM